jgi:hypothetical protein
MGSGVGRSGALLLVGLALLGADAASDTPRLGEAFGDVGTIAQSETKSHTIQIDDTTMTAIWLVYGKGNLNLALVTPAGELLDSTSIAGRADVHWEEQPFPLGGIVESISLLKPAVGSWTVRVTAPTVDEPTGVAAYIISVLVQGGVRVDVDAVPDDPIVGETVRIRARLTRDGVMVPGAVLGATLVRPDKSRREVAMKDDGVRPDSARGDGVYTGETRETPFEGVYRVHVTASSGATRESVWSAREGSTEFAVAKSRLPEDRMAAWEVEGVGPLEPPVEIRARLERGSGGRASEYVYTVSNGSPFPILSFHIGTAPQAGDEIETPPLGWEDVRNVPRSNYSGPPGWDLLYGNDIHSRGSLMWSARDSASAIGPGQSVTGFRVSVPKPDPTYERAHWLAFLQSEVVGTYRGLLVSTRDPAPPGDAIQQLGNLQIDSKNRRATARFRCPAEAHPEVAILDSSGHLVSDATLDESPGPERRATWNGRNLAGHDLPAGNYFVWVQYGNTQRFGRISLAP